MFGPDLIMFSDGSLVRLTVHGVPCTATSTIPIQANWMRSTPFGAKTQNGSSQNLIQAILVAVCSRGSLIMLEGPEGWKKFLVMFSNELIK